MPRKYPPLERREIVQILTALGFQPLPLKGTSHEQFEATIDGKKRKVTVVRNCNTFDERDIKSFVTQAGVIREDFYGATKGTAKKIGIYR